MRTLTLVPALAFLAALGAPAAAETVTEPRSGVAFEARLDGNTLLGVGVRTKTMLKVKVYAVGLYVSDSALAGALAQHKGKPPSPALYNDLQWGDFDKRIVMKFTRDVTAEQIRDAFRESLAGADKAPLETFLALFGNTRAGQEYVLRWLPGGTLEPTLLGEKKAPIADKKFAATVFGCWLGPKPIQEDIKQGLVARFR